jgi:hypothetical protein
MSVLDVQRDAPANSACISEVEHEMPYLGLIHPTAVLLVSVRGAVAPEIIDCRATAEFAIPVANAAGYNRDSVSDYARAGRDSALTF